MNICRKVRRCTTMILSFLLVFTMANAPAAAGAVVTGQRIEGMVYYSRTPIAGIQIKLFNQDPTSSLIATTVSDASGKYALTNIPAGTYYLEVSSPTHEWLGRNYFLPDQPGQGSITYNVYVMKAIDVLQPKADALLTTLHPVFCWQPLAEAARYSLQVNSYPAGDLIEVRDNLTATCYETSSALHLGATYEWFLSAWDADGKEIGHNYAFTPQRFHIRMLMLLPYITNASFLP